MLLPLQLLFVLILSCKEDCDKGNTLIKNEKLIEKGDVMSFGELIAQAGRQRRIVRLKLKPKDGDSLPQSGEFEPYNAREFGGKVSFFCLDVEKFACQNVDLASVVDAEITERSFKPRFPVAF